MRKVKKLSSEKPLGRLKFSFESVVRVYEGPADWYFAHLPKELSVEISELFADQKRGFGSLPVEVSLGGIVWQTSIFPDSSAKTYMLPLKAAVRKQAGIGAGSKIKLAITINV